MALVAALLLFAVAAYAAPNDDQVIFPGRTPAAAPSPAASGTVHSLTLVLGLALAAAGGWFVWRNRQRAPGSRQLSALAIDETRSLGNRQYLVVASYEGKRFLLGVCPGRIDMLTPLDGSAGSEKARG